MALEYYPLHGRWGAITVDGVECAEVTDVEAEVQINRVDVVQSGNRWKGYIPGDIEGSGSMTVMKSNSWFDKFIYDWVSKGPGSVKGSFDISLTVDDPHYDAMTGTTTGVTPSDWSQAETMRLTGCQFWNMPLGYQRGSVIQRRYNFTFSGLTVVTAIKAVKKGSEPSETAVDATRQGKLPT